MRVKNICDGINAMYRERYKVENRIKSDMNRLDLINKQIEGLTKGLANECMCKLSTN